MQSEVPVPAPSRKRSAKSRLAEDFDGIARRYDLLQRLNPGYRRHLRLSARRLAAPPAGRLLDLCCGTGLSTEALVARYPKAHVDALDASRGMLEVARRKRALREVRLLEGEAERPVDFDARGPYDGILVAYGIRNVVDPDRCLANLLSLLKPGGRIALHEYSVQDSRYAQMVWNVMARAVIVPLGKALTGSEALFQYLRQSVNDFDGVELLQRRVRDAGFSNVRVHPVDGWQRHIVHTVTAERAR